MSFRRVPHGTTAPAFKFKIRSQKTGSGSCSGWAAFGDPHRNYSRTEGPTLGARQQKSWRHKQWDVVEGIGYLVHLYVSQEVDKHEAPLVVGCCACADRRTAPSAQTLTALIPHRFLAAILHLYNGSQDSPTEEKRRCPPLLKCRDWCRRSGESHNERDTSSGYIRFCKCSSQHNQSPFPLVRVGRLLADIRRTWPSTKRNMWG